MFNDSETESKNGTQNGEMTTNLCYEGEFCYFRPYQPYKEFHIRVSIIEDTDSLPCFLVQITDISERVKLNEAQVTDQIKTMMLCSISHELRTPLNQIKGTIELSKHESDKRVINNYLKIADRASDMLLYKIDDILDYYEIESEKFIIREEQLNLKLFLQRIDQLMRPQIRENNLYFSIHIENGVDDEIIFDKLRINRVIVNLLNNAIKYTQSGFITLIVSKMNSNKIRFAVSDTGCGIKKNQQKDLFKLFSKFKDNQDSTKLVGLGLSISQILLNKLGSELK